MMPMVLARRDKAWQIAAVCTIASVIGGLFGYMIGYFLWDAIGQQVMDFYGYAAKMEEFAALYNEWGFWIVAAAGFTTVRAGAAGVSSSASRAGGRCTKNSAPCATSCRTTCCRCSRS